MHWFEDLLSRIINAKPKQSIVCNAGASISGLQHVGRLRGEVVLTNVIANGLRDAGKDVIQHLTLYTQDPWKGKDAQVGQFQGDEGKQYVNRRLIDVPDPKGCCDGWVKHFWHDFGDYLDRFANDVNVISTTELYEKEGMKPIIMEIVKKKDEVREIVNRYRGTKKYGEDWLPFEPYCTQCKTIGRAKALKVGDRVEYRCSCGHEGSSPLNLGKLNWRLEWPAIWKLLEVDIEPFGKDHATPGGSRDSCVEIANKIFGIEAPFGIPYEWVGYSKDGTDMGDMSSSGSIGFTPKDWVEVAEPEVLRYIYLRSDPMKRIVLDLAKIDIYYDAFDSAENSFFKTERDEQEELDAFGWKLAVFEERKKRFMLAFRHAALLSQILPLERDIDWALDRLKDTGIIKTELGPEDVDSIRTRIKYARRWVDEYAPQYKVKLTDTIDPNIKSGLSDDDKTALQMFAETLASTEWSENAIKDSMMNLTKSGNLPVGTKRFFTAFYLVFLGTEKGPRAAPFLSILNKDFVIKRLKEASG
jgi:lysyl-tRNA synthetase class 1